MSKKIVVRHYSKYCSGGGAFIAAKRLHEAMNTSNSSPFISYFADSKLIQPLYSTRLSRWLSPKVSHTVSKLLSYNKNYFNSFPALGFLGKMNYELPSEGVSHLHWVADGFLHPEYITALPGKLVWTLHDSWPFLGAEHHPISLNDFSFHDYYISRRSNSVLSRYSVDNFVLRLKRKIASRSVCLLAPSTWMKSQVRLSPLFADSRCEVIPNIIPDAFCLTPKAFAREKLELPKDKPIVICSTYNSGDKAKGGDLLEPSIRRVVTTFSTEFLLIQLIIKNY